MKKIQITGAVSEADKERLETIRTEKGYTNHGQSFAFLLDFYLKHKDRPKTSTGEVVKSGKELFHVKINPRAQEQMELVRQEYFEKHGYSDPQILYHFLKIEKLIREDKAFLIKPAPKVCQKIQEKAGPAIEEGDARNISDWISRFLKDMLSEKPKPKSNGLFG